MNQAGYLTLPETATVAGALLMFSQRLLRSVTMANDFFESAPLVRDLNEFLALEPRWCGCAPGRPTPVSSTRSRSTAPRSATSVPARTPWRR